MGQKQIIVGTVLALMLGGLGTILTTGDKPIMICSPESSVSYVYIADYGPIIWPAGTRLIRSFLISDDGDVQYVEREGRKTVKQLREGRTDFEQIRGVLLDHWPLRRKEQVKSRVTDQGLIREVHPGFIQVWVYLRGKPVQFWEGAKDDLPPPWRAIIEKTKSHLTTLPAHEAETVQAWLHADLLTPEVAAVRVVKAISDEDLSRSPRLQEALVKPFLLVPVYEGENPFAPLSWSGFSPGQSIAHISWRDCVFFVYPLHNGLISE